MFNDKSVILLHPGGMDSQGLAEIKTYGQKMQDVQVTKSLQQTNFVAIIYNFRASEVKVPSIVINVA